MLRAPARGAAPVLCAALLLLSGPAACARPVRRTPPPAAFDALRRAQRPAVEAHLRYFPFAAGVRRTYRTVRDGRATAEWEQVLAAGPDARALVDGDGAVWRVDARGVHDGARYVLAAPLTIGAVWRAVPGPGVNETLRIIDTEARLKVPAGTFERCIVVARYSESDGGPPVLTVTWFAPGVGPARIDVRAAGADGTLRPFAVHELVRWSLPASALPAAPPAGAPRVPATPPRTTP